MARTVIAFATIGVLLCLLFSLDLVWGAVDISLWEALEALFGGERSDTNAYLIRHFRLPKALTALLAGAGVSVAGLMMQGLFRNPLADTSILGIGSGAGVGVAVYTMAFALIPGLTLGAGAYNAWGVATASFVGALAVLVLIAALAAHIREVVSVLVVGVMIGFLAGALISVLQYLSEEDVLRGYLLWSFGSVAGTTWRELSVLAPVVLAGLTLTLLMPKYLNALMLGESYTRSLGISPRRVRLLIILTTSLIVGGITAFTGPIAFLGIAVPHLARMTFGTADHRRLIPGTILLGATLMLACDILTQWPGRMLVLPINAITSLIGAPMVIYIILRRQRRGSRLA